LNERAERDGDCVLADIAREDAPQLIASLVSAGARIFEARWIKPSLEDVFVSHVAGGAGV
jgi:hypothetical protein